MRPTRLLALPDNGTLVGNLLRMEYTLRAGVPNPSLDIRGCQHSG